MELLKSIFLGIIQGLTEFLPVSSSGHLVLFENILNLKFEGVAFETVLHAGTLLSLAVYFFKDIRKLAFNGFSGRNTEERRMLLYIILGTIPTGLIGLPLEKFFDSFKSVPFVAVMLMITGLIVYAGSRPQKAEGRKIKLLDSIIIGICQGIAVIPGISRSGITISSGILRGIDRNEAARFSFLLSMPAVFGAFVLQLKHISKLDASLAVLAGGFLASFISGLIALKFLFGIIGRGKFRVFSYYCLAAGIFILFVHMLRS